MSRRSARRIACRLAALLACAAAGACTTLDDERIARLDDAQAQALLAPGRTTTADVRAALGEGGVVRFRSGWQTWHYDHRAGVPKGWDDVPFIGLVTSRSARPTKELVLLFDADGVLRRYALQDLPPEHAAAAAH
jgi:hypothetical protein